MKIIYKVILIGMFVITLVGCDNKVEFNRVETLNNSSPEYAPYSRYIKKQILILKVDDKLERTITDKYDKQGRCILTYAVSDIKIFNDRSKKNYQNKTFNYYSSLFRTNASGHVVFDSMGKEIAYIGTATEDGKSEQLPYNSFNFYDNDKLVSNETQLGNFLIKGKANWKNDLITYKTFSYFRKYGAELFSIELGYGYDKLNRISTLTTWAKFPDRTIKSKTTFTNYNQFGDWTKGFVDHSESGQKSPTIITREIEYW